MQPLHTPSSPHMHAPVSVRALMLWVLAALLPALAAHLWCFGPGILLQLALAGTAALAGEAAILRLRRRPLWPSLSDGSALVSAALLCFAIPPLAPWWIIVIGSLFAIVVAKHLYGGLGQNPFNPAMAAYVLLLVSFPLQMTQWSAVGATPAEHGGVFSIIFGGGELDALSGATPLDHLRTELTRKHAVAEALADTAVQGWLGGRGWEWINLMALLGGLLLLWRRVIQWHIPVAMLASLFVCAAAFHLLDPARFGNPLWHLFTGASMLGAFFIATDPVSAASTRGGRLLFGAGIGLLTYIIRTWGGYPDGVAFAVLLMNMAAPTLDQLTRPRVFGHTRDE